MGLLDLLSDLLGGDGEGDERPTGAQDVDDGTDEAGGDDAGGDESPADGGLLDPPGEADAVGPDEWTFDPGPEPPTIPAVDLDPGMDVDAAHERAVVAFEDQGYHVTPGTLMNSVDGPLEGVGKLLNFQPEQGMHTAVVVPGEWDDEAVNAVLTLAGNLRTEPMTDGVHLVSAVEPPAALSYLMGSHPRGALALAAMVEVQNGPAFEPDALPHYAEVGRELLAEHFGLAVDVDDLDSLAALDEAVLSGLRTVDDPERPEEGHVPREALYLVGALAGEVMRRGLERELDAETAWTDAGAISSTGVGLEVTLPHGEGGTVNPVGKALKLFENGDTDSLAFMYQTARAAVSGDLD